MYKQVKLTINMCEKKMPIKYENIFNLQTKWKNTI